MLLRLFLIKPQDVKQFLDPDTRAYLKHIVKYFEILLTF